MKTNFFSKLKVASILFLLTIIYSSLKAQSSFVELQLAGRYSTSIFDEGATEIAAFDKESGRIFSTNANDKTIDVIDINNPENPVFLFSIDITLYGGGANSVACMNGVVAVAVENDIKQLNGHIVFFDTDGTYLNDVEVGALPDMVVFTPNGEYVLSANEGEPDDDYLVDPLGSISIIDVTGGFAGLTSTDVTTLDFTAFNSATLDPSIKINGPGSTVAQDLEPEYIAIAKNSKTAWVTLQENNAIAIINIQSKEIFDVVGLGYKDFNLPGNGIDASNKADDIDIRNWPVYGLFMPDAITYISTSAGNYIVTANEGDGRDYAGFEEETRIEDIVLDSLVFPNYADLQNEDSLGRLKVISTLGDIDSDGEYEELYAYGARSFTVWDPFGNIVYDSGDYIEQYLAAEFPDNFNASNDNQEFKDRSDDKGPEPEAITNGVILGNPYLFLGLERIGGIMLFDMSTPTSPEMVDYDNTRDFSNDPELDILGDYGPEGLLFISAKESPNGKNLLISSNEVSGTIAIYYTDYECGKNKVSVCFEGIGYCLPIPVAEALVSLGGIPGPCDDLRYTNLLDENDLEYGISVYPNPANNLVNVSLNKMNSGDWNINLFDMTGRIIRSLTTTIDSQTPIQTLQFDVAELPQGTYICKIYNDFGESFNEQIVVFK